MANIRPPVEYPKKIKDPQSGGGLAGSEQGRGPQGGKRDFREVWKPKRSDQGVGKGGGAEKKKEDPKNQREVTEANPKNLCRRKQVEAVPRPSREKREYQSEEKKLS